MIGVVVAAAAVVVVVVVIVIAAAAAAARKLASEYLWVSPLTMGITAGRPRRRTRAVGFPTTHRGEHCGYVPKSLEFHFEGWGGHHFTHVRGDPSYHFLTREGLPGYHPWADHYLP